jgi:hypothetical protein
MSREGPGNLSHNRGELADAQTKKPAFSYLIFALNFQTGPPMHRRKPRAGHVAAEPGLAIDLRL